MSLIISLFQESQAVVSCDISLQRGAAQLALSFADVPSATGSLSGALREPKASSSFTSLPSTDSGAPGNESSQCRAKHQMSIHSGIHCASCSMDPLLARSVSAQEPAAAVLQCRRQPNPGKWTLKSGAGAHGACSFSPLSGRSARQCLLVGLGRQLPNTNFRHRGQ